MHRAAAVVSECWGNTGERSVGLQVVTGVNGESKSIPQKERVHLLNTQLPFDETHEAGGEPTCTGEEETPVRGRAAQNWRRPSLWLARCPRWQREGGSDLRPLEKGSMARLCEKMHVGRSCPPGSHPRYTSYCRVCGSNIVDYINLTTQAEEAEERGKRPLMLNQDWL